MTQSKTEKILNYLPDFLEKGEGNNYDFITSFDSEFQDLEDNITGLKESIQLSTSTGTYLDDIGKLFSLTRYSGETDSSYRERIKSFWQSRKGGGTATGIKEALYNLTNTPVSYITVADIDDMIIHVTVPINNFSSSSSAISVDNSVQETKAAGIYATSEVIPFYEFDEPFDNSTNINSSLTTAVISGGSCTFPTSGIGLPKQLTSIDVVQSTLGNWDQIRITGIFTGTIDKIYLSVDGVNWEDAGTITTTIGSIYTFINDGANFFYKIISRDAVIYNIYFEFTVEGI